MSVASEARPALQPSALSPWPHPLGWLQQQIKGWWESRLPRSDTHALTQRNVYILPSRAGLMFAITLVTLLLASINYQLSLGYVLTFLLAGSGVVSMHLTHNTLRGLQLHLRPVLAVFAGDPAAVEVVLVAPPQDRQPRHGIGLQCDAAGQDQLSWVDVPAGGQTTAHLAFIAAQRGWQWLPSIAVHTRFPLGLFRAWTIWRPATRCLVYPRPEHPAAPMPSAGAAAGNATLHRSAGQDETEGVRAYRRGDSQRLIVWRKAAKLMEAGGELLSRDTSSSAQQQLWLDWQATGALDTEARLSRMCAWVIRADQLGLAYGLQLPGLSLPPAHGEAHRRRCLEALALWR
jgi:uncharacterized protein (DUF58 family)